MVKLGSMGPVEMVSNISLRSTSLTYGQFDTSVSFCNFYSHHIIDEHYLVGGALRKRVKIQSEKKITYREVRMVFLFLLILLRVLG